MGVSCALDAQYDLMITRGATVQTSDSSASDGQALGPTLRVLASSGAAPSPWETEPNDSIATADPLWANFVPVAPGQYTAVVEGTIATSYDNDYYRIMALPGDRLVIDDIGSYPYSLSDTYLYLRDENGAVLTQDDDGGEGTNSYIDYSFPADGPAGPHTYYIEASKFSTCTGTYRLTASLYTSVLPLPTASYVFQAEADDNLAITLAAPGSQPGEPQNDLGLWADVYNPDGSLLGSATLTSPLSPTAGTSGTYSVRVRTLSGSGPYVLSVIGATPAPLAALKVTGGKTAEGVELNEGTLLNQYPSAIILTFSTSLDWAASPPRH